MLQIDSTNTIILDGQRTAFAVTQKSTGTVVYTKEDRTAGTKYCEHQMPHARYMLAATGVSAKGAPGLDQFEADFKRLIALM